MKATKSKSIEIPPFKHVIEWSEEDKAWLVYFPELPGCKTHGETVKEALENGEVALRLYIETMIDNKMEVPIPISKRSASGKIPLRIAPILHKQLMILAERKEKSLNKYIEQILEEAIED